MSDLDIIVLGGGLVGSAIGYGLQRRSLKIAVLDEGDVALRASRGNFGLVWVQSKGQGFPPYADWARHSADVWPGFAAELEERTGHKIDYSKRGGFSLCMSEKEFDDRALMIKRMHNQQGPKGYDVVMMDRAEVQRMMPAIGPEVVGGSYCPHDGHVSPLRLLRALHAALGDAYHNEHRVSAIRTRQGGFEVVAGEDTFAAGRIVLAAGLGNLALAQMLGAELPIRPQRGQILVTERLPAFLDYPMNGVRQTAEGSVMLGSSREEVGFDNGTKPDVLSTIARNAVRAFPILARARIVRAWGALRVLAPDEHPIYQSLPGHDGAVVATCHSGVSLAGAHALDFAGYLAEGKLPDRFAAFHSRRFDVQATA
ncbi:MAG: FAD-binding oxidoreductase [Alphaproteobacteria bacterium]|nr:FAD-binding oxidoreductase [Alphaproteobacteria bacterium]